MGINWTDKNNYKKKIDLTAQVPYHRLGWEDVGVTNRYGYGYLEAGILS
jgi:hypothetical protein